MKSGLVDRTFILMSWVESLGRHDRSKVVKYNVMDLHAPELLS